MASNEQIFAAIILSIIATSTFIGVVNLAYNNKLPDFFRANQIEGQIKWQSPSQILTSSTSTIIDSQDYTNSSGFDTNTTILKAGTWEYDSTGFHTVSGQALSWLLLLNNIIPNGNIYTVSYQINNSESHSFYLTPRWQFTDQIFGSQNGFSESDIHIDIDSTGVHVKKYPLTCFVICIEGGDTFFYPYPDAQMTPVGGFTTWTTILTNNINPNGLSPFGTTSSLTVARDEITLFTTAVKDENPAYPAYHGGIGTAWTGLTVVKTLANFQYFYGSSTYPSSSTADPFSRGLDLVIGWFMGVFSFVGSLAVLLGYSISSDICPLWVTTIVMTPQFAVLGLIGIKLIRGTS